MKAMVLTQQGDKLELMDQPTPTPAAHQVLLEVQCCGVCRTDLHILDDDLDEPNLPLIPGHQIVGVIKQLGEDVTQFSKGDKVGVPWLGETCGHCEFCRNDRENLCNNARFTGYNIDGGFAEYTVADAQYCFPVPPDYADEQAAPLLCAGLIGYRSLRKVGDAKKLGFYGFGSSAHILAQVAQYQDREVYAFTRPGDEETQNFAREIGAVWAGNSKTLPPEKLDAVIIFAPVGPLVPQSLKSIKKGGSVVCAGIHMSEIPSFSYDMLWGERSVESVANLSRKDGTEFLQLAPKVPVKTNITTYPLRKANQALHDLREGNFDGSAVLQVS